MSHSARSAWIETLVFIDFTLSGNGRTPQGVRGLKLHPHDGRELGDKSHSARSAWIETSSSSLEDSIFSRTPQGVRGLKQRG